MPLMADSEIPDVKISEWLRDNPCVLNNKGNIRTCPVRLSFPALFEKSKPVEAGQEGKYGANLLFPVGADLSVLEDEVLETLSRASWYTPGQRGMMLPIKDPAKMPLKDPGGMLAKAGFQEGMRYVIATSNDKPLVVDRRFSPITDESKVYPGVWAFAEIRPFSYNKGVNKGVGFGLQQVMIIADDLSLGGRGALNPQATFGGVKLDPNTPTGVYFGEEVVTGDKPMSKEEAKRALFG